MDIKSGDHYKEIETRKIFKVHAIFYEGEKKIIQLFSENSKKMSFFSEEKLQGRFEYVKLINKYG